MKKMGVGDGMRIVVYDTLGMFSAPRAWWTFRAMGHEDVAVLDGGLKKWKAEGRELEDGPPRKRTERHFTPLMNASLIRDMDDVKKVIQKRSAQLVDARPAGRFEGTEPEPRPGLRRGHLPGARNVPSQIADQCRRHVEVDAGARQDLRRRRHRSEAARSSPRAARA